MSDREFEPLSGDADTLQSKANQYLNIANAITRSVVTLRKIHSVDGMTSQAVDAIKEKSGGVADDIDRAQQRYEVTAKALLAYSSALRQAQDDARTAISHITAKQGEADSAHRTETHAKDKVTSATDTDKTTAQTEADKAVGDSDSADQALRAAHGEWHAAVQAKNDAADRAVKAIVEVVSGKKNNGLEDSGWDDWGSKLYDAFKTICKWAGVLAIFLAWVPGLGQILMVLAAIGAVLELLDSVIAVIAGKGSWGDVLMASVGVVLTFAGGALLAHLGKLAKSAMIVKSVPKLAGDAQMLGRMRGILKLKDGESIAPELLSASKQMRMGLKDIMKEPFKALVPKSVINDASEFTRANFLKMLKEAGPGSPIKNAFKINGDTLQAIKMGFMNPSALADPMVFARVAIPATIQGVQTVMASTTMITDPAAFIKDPTNFLGGPTVDAIKGTQETIHHIWG